MQGYIKIERYSNYGFTPQYQTHHINKFLGAWKCNWREYFLKIPRKMDFEEYWHEVHKLEEITEKEKEYFRKYRKDIRLGVWVFYYGEKVDLELNHLNTIPPKHVGWLPDDTMCFDCNFFNDPVTLKWDYEHRARYGVFVPAHQLSKLIIIDQS